MDEAFEKTDKLSVWPNIGRKVTEENNHNIREIAHYSYRIIYQIFETHVDILTIIHGRREYVNPANAD